MISRLFFALVAFLFWSAGWFSAPVLAQSAVPGSAASENCADARESGQYLIFADISNDKPKWKKFASQAEFEKYRETQATFSIAKVGMENGRVSSATYYVFFESGDHAKYVKHCFRSDGTLASAVVEFRTFYGDYVLTDELEFDTAGRKTRSTRTLRDLATNEPKVVQAEYISELKHLIEGHVYKKVNCLPFAALLKKK